MTIAELTIITTQKLFDITLVYCVKFNESASQDPGSKYGLNDILDLYKP